MTKLNKLENQLKELKLQKRNLLLAGKDTEEIDILIKEIEERIKNEKILN